MNSPPFLNPDYEIYRKPQHPIDPGDPEEQRDYIEADRFNMIDFRGRYLFMMNQDHLELTETLSASRALISHRFYGRPVNRETLQLIAFRIQCYNVTKDLYIDDDLIQELATWYTDMRKHQSLLSLQENPHTSLQADIARYYVVPQDLYAHFRNFDSLNDTHERFERKQAIDALMADHTENRWLLRHSSYNRPKNPNTLADIIKFGIRYYVLSYSKKRHDTMIVKHVLIIFNVISGWSTSIDDTLIFTNFIDCLEHILQTHNLTFTNIYSDYFNF